MEIQLPQEVSEIIERLEEAGFEAYAVGGCVRDAILGRVPGDWDITTSAEPNQIKRIFRRTVDTGIEHGTVTVLMKEGAYEVTTYRLDGVYEDARHPSGVTFVRNLTEDLKRRDFTINAMAYNKNRGLIDMFGGIEDLENKKIRCVGDPMLRFGEDALRILRAIRFSAQLGFDIENDTEQAICDLAVTLKKISAERICTELIKILVSDRPETLRRAYRDGVTAVFLPEFDRLMETDQCNPHHCRNVGEHTIEAMKNIPADRVLRLTMLLHDIGKPVCATTDEAGNDHFQGHAVAGVELAKDVLQRLKMDNDTIKKVLLLVRHHDWRFPPEKKNVRKALHVLGEELFPLLLLVKKADTLAQSEYRRDEKLAWIDAVEKQYQEIIMAEECFSLKEMKLTGADLIAAGFKPGPQIGEMLNAALEEVIKDPQHNEKEYLMQYINKSFGGMRNERI